MTTQKRHHVKSTPINIQKLISSLGPENAAASLGLTLNTIKKYVRQGKAPYSTELAAQSIVAGNGNKRASAVIHGEPGAIEAIKKLIVASGGGFSLLQ